MENPTQPIPPDVTGVPSSSDWLGSFALNPLELQAASEIPAVMAAIKGEHHVGVAMVQRRLGWSYNHAVGVLDVAEKVGAVGKVGANWKRQVNRWCELMERPADLCRCPDCGPCVVDYAGE